MAVTVVVRVVVRVCGRFPWEAREEPGVVSGLEWEWGCEMVTG